MKKEYCSLIYNSIDVVHDLSGITEKSNNNGHNRVLSCFVAVLCIILYVPTIAWLWDRWTLSVWHHAHGLLIVPVVGYLVWTELRRVSHLPRSSCGWGFIILVPALILHMLDAGMHTQLLSAAALVMALPGLSLLLIGMQRTRVIAFPLLFLTFTLPIPLVFTEQLHLTLRIIATVSVSFIIPLLSLPLVTEGTTLYISNGTLQVADACSGFSTLYATVAIACLTAYMTPYRNRRIIVLLAAAPIAISANIAKVILLVLLFHFTGMEILGTSLHTISGLFTFALALPVVFFIGFKRKKNT
jgi:exosortase